MIEIDGVRHELEAPITEAGDYISDEYLLLIDFSTAPHSSHRNTERIASAIRRLNRNLAATSVYLVGTEFAQPYNDVVAQLNTINASLNVGSLNNLIEDDSRFLVYSASFRHAA